MCFALFGLQGCEKGEESEEDFPAECGNGVVEHEEECDDGNTSNDDNCLDSCVEARCGDGFVAPARESCDDGNRNNDDDCTNACGLASCGDGIVQEGEECDDGNNDDRDDCLPSCIETSCGDGIVQEGEECDDGNEISSDACLPNCTLATCGDGELQIGIESCDDGNDIDTDECTNDCAPPSCGDGIVQDKVEKCDDGNDSETDSCRSNCLPAACGDGVVQEGVEECDDGNLKTESCDYGLESCAVCNAGCKLVSGATEYCGDGVVQGERDEVCDGDCPTTCVDKAACTSGDLVDEGCQAQCVNVDPICVSNDGCCGAGCTKEQDSDCECVISGFDVPGDGIDSDCDGADLSPDESNGIFVATTGNDSNPGTRVAPKRTINAALAALKLRPQRNVYIARGTYVETIILYDYSLFGGFHPTTWSRDTRQHVTTLQGNPASRRLAFGTSVLDYRPAVDLAGRQALIDGFTILPGADPKGMLPSEWNCEAPVILRGSSRISNSVIYGTTCQRSSAVDVQLGRSSSKATIVNSLIFGGTGTQSNEGVYISTTASRTAVYLYHNLIVGGSGGQYATGVRVTTNSSVTIVNNIIRSGFASRSTGASGIRNDASDSLGRLTLRHNALSGECLVGRGSTCIGDIGEINDCSSSACERSHGNIVSDCDLDGAYRLSSGSSCIDAGENPLSYGGNVATDRDGDTRPNQGAWDIGPDEFLR